MNFARKIIKKAKKQNQPLANGKIIVADFSTLDPSDFCTGSDKKEFCGQAAALSFDGRIYVNSNTAWCEAVSGIFQLISRETIKDLTKYAKLYQKAFPNIKTFEDCGRIAELSENEQIHALTMLLVPVEKMRREREAAYYGR